MLVQVVQVMLLRELPDSRERCMWELLDSSMRLLRFLPSKFRFESGLLLSA